MNVTQKVVVSLIKSAVEDIQVILPSDDIDWIEIFKLCKKAQITAIIFESLEKNKCKVPEEAFELFKQSALFQVVIDQHQKYHIDHLIESFYKSEIDFALLKGSSIKGTYPISFYRTMSDIDILIKTEQYGIIKEIMLQLSYVEGPETDHELMWYNTPYIHIELHKRLIPSYNKDFFEYYGDGWGFMEKHQHHQYKMSPENEFIYLFTHFSKHYRDGGIGIRHILDLWIFKRHYNDLDEKYIIKELERLHLDKFYQNIIDTIAFWFNDKQRTAASEIITNTVFQSGSYGNKEKSDNSYALRISRKHSNAFAAKISNLFNLIFMPLSLMRKKYAVLNKTPLLLPIFWVVRWADALMFKKSNIKRQSDRTNHISQNNINQYQAELNAVGLDYYF